MSTVLLNSTFYHDYKLHFHKILITFFSFMCCIWDRQTVSNYTHQSWHQTAIQGYTCTSKPIKKKIRLFGLILAFYHFSIAHIILLTVWVQIRKHSILSADCLKTILCYFDLLIECCLLLKNPDHLTSPAQYLIQNHSLMSLVHSLQSPALWLAQSQDTLLWLADCWWSLAHCTSCPLY